MGASSRSSNPLSPVCHPSAELLVEIALRIHECQPDHGHSQVATLLEKSPAKKPKPPA